MSAFVVNPEHIDVLVRAGLATTGDTPLEWADPTGATMRLTPDTARRVGAMLWAQNVRSVDHRYGLTGDEDAEAFHVFSWRPFTPNPVVVLKAVDCYEYQACETDDWPRAEAASYCQRLRLRMISLLPGYADAPWAITDLGQAQLP